MSFIIGEGIKKRLSQLLIDFQPMNIDKKLFYTCVEDFYNWLKVQWKRDIEEKTLEDVNVNLTVEKMLYTRMVEDDNAIEEFKCWLNMWLGKWKQRVQLLFGFEPLYNKYFQQVTQVMFSTVTLDEMLQFREPVIERLISKGEIVGTETLVAGVIKRVASKFNQVEGLKDKIAFLSQCYRIIDDLASHTGKLIFVSLKDYDWRITI